MSLFEDNNPYRGLSVDDADRATRLRSARRMAGGSVVLAVLWGFGFLSLGAMAAAYGANRYLATEDPSTTYRRVAWAGFTLGALGLVIAVYFGLTTSR